MTSSSRANVASSFTVVKGAMIVKILLEAPVASGTAKKAKNGKANA